MTQYYTEIDKDGKEVKKPLLFNEKACDKNVLKNFTKDKSKKTSKKVEGEYWSVTAEKVYDSLQAEGMSDNDIRKLDKKALKKKRKIAKII